MEIRENAGELKRIQRTLAGFTQRTFQTPLDHLPRFVAALLAGEPPIIAASVTVQQVVFTPQHLEKLLASYRLPLEYGTEQSIAAEGAQESAALLAAALADWIDFYFVPEPKRFILYADHDEYATLFAPRKGMLSLIASGLIDAGFKEVPDYIRDL